MRTMHTVVEHIRTIQLIWYGYVGARQYSAEASSWIEQKEKEKVGEKFEGK